MSPTQGVIQEAWQLYLKHWQRFVSIALVVYVISGVFVAVAALAGSLTALIFVLILGFIAQFLLQGALVKAVQDVQDGQADLTIGETFKSATPFIPRLMGAGILAGLGIGVGFLLLIVPGLILMTIWVFIVPAIVVENRGAIESFTRSRELVRGYGWNIFGVIVLVYVIQIVANQLLSLVLSPLSDVPQIVVSYVVSGGIIGPFVIVTWTLLYFRMVDAKSGAGPAVPPPTV